MKHLPLLILASASLLASAQSKIDFPGRLAIEQVRLQTADNAEGTVAPMSAAAGPVFSVIVTLADPAFDFAGTDAEVVSRIGGMAVVNATAAQIEALAALPEVTQVSLGFEKEPYMYLARPAANVGAVQEGADGLPQAYTGRGVVTGLFDVGLDVNHVNFLDADGQPRTKAVWAWNSGSRPNAYTTPQQIKNFTTENSGETHGTHVLGIMSGSYTGPATYAYLNNGRSTFVEQTAEDSSIPFYGIATEADIAVGCGPLSDSNIATGVQNIIDYAIAQGQPCVVNLSIGSNMGPHDGTDGITRYLAELGEKAIICIAAGNEGDDNISISTTGKEIKTFTDLNGSAMVQFWGSDNTPFTIRFFGYDRSKSKEVFSYTLDTNLAGKSVSQKDMTGFVDAFSGTVTLSSNINSANNRYNVSASLNLSAVSSTIMPGFAIIPASETQSVDGFANKCTFASNSVRGFTSGNAKNSISSMACGANVIVVGSFTTEPTWAALNSTKTGATAYSYSPKPSTGAISGFSSYGTAFGGRQLPDICAPGEGVCSSFSQYYVDAAGASTNGWLVGEYAVKKGLTARNSPWGLMQGTSMACPFVAGVVATWLQADPTLTCDDVMSVIRSTAITDFATKNNAARFGAGKIDALSGIKAVIASAGIADVAVASGNLIVSTADSRNFDISLPGASGLAVTLHSLSGTAVAAARSGADSLTLSAEALTPGIYILRAVTSSATHTKKIIVK